MFRLLFLLAVYPFFLSAQTHPINIDDLWKMKRITDFDISKDGTKIVFGIKTYYMEKNNGNEDIYIINSSGMSLKPVKSSEKNESKPRFSPDGAKITYLEEGKIWECNLDGSNTELLSDIYTPITDYKWSNDGKQILFVSEVYPDCRTQNCNKQKDIKKDTSKVRARLITGLMFRHWDEWRSEKRSHLFLLNVENKNFIDLTPGIKNDVPPIALGSPDDFNFAPDSNEAAFTMNSSDTVATNTNNDVYVVNLNDTAKISGNNFTKISEGKGDDYQPVYSPDGKYIAFTSKAAPGFESDKSDLILYNRHNKNNFNLTRYFALSVDQFIWSPDSKYIYYTADNQINKSIYKVEIKTGLVNSIIEENTNSKIHISGDGGKIFFTKQSSVLPEEIFSVNIDGTNLKQITFLNKDLLSQLKMVPVETFWTEGAGGVKVQSILVKPPDFDPKKQYPMIFLIHGGPQGNWCDEFHYRWNLQMFAAPGYVVVAPNPRGSTGYGQKFTNEISKDWGGKVYDDLMNTYNYAVRNFRFIDGRNTFAAGGSYGGYMVNWIEGHNDRFNALVSHDGTFNLESMYGTTEELWFPEWEFGGTPWHSRAAYEKWSPHRYIQNAKTPMLIVQGGKDFRVSEEQGFQLFTSLQRLGVPSELLYFPDEGHWVLKPQNARLWWHTIFDWFKKYSK